MKKRTTFLMVLVLALALTIGPTAKADSVQLDESSMAALVGGDGSMYCALGYGISAGLAIGGTIIALTGAGAPAGAGIRVAGMLLGLGVAAACAS